MVSVDVKHHVYLLGRKCLEDGFEGVLRGFLWEREGKVFHVEGWKTETVGTNSGKSGRRNLEAKYEKQSRE